jgi:EmrB/QacA subfamily drug resistance transporter
VAENQRGQVGVVIGALMLGLLLAALDATIVSTALPTIVGELGGLDHYTWVVTSYLLTLTVSTPVYGKLGDLYGRKRLFQTAIIIFLIGSALSGLSQTMNQLIAFRAVQGIGGGGLIVGAQAIVGDIVSPRERGRYQGYFGAVFGLASVAGPLVGGFLVDSVSWRWVFYVNLPIGAFALAAVAVTLHTPTERVHHEIDYRGAVLIGAAATCLILVTTWGGTQYSWTSPTIIGLAVGGVVLLAMFVAAERRVEEPMVPPRLFRNPIFVVACAVGFVAGASLYGATTYLPQYQQIVRGESATSSGLQLIPLMVGVVTASLVSGQLITRYARYKRYPVAGTAFMALGLLLLSGLTVDTSTARVGIYMAVLGVGIGLTMQVLILVAQNSVNPRDLGTATSTATFCRTIGGSFGVALFGGVFNASFDRHLGSAGLGSFQGNPTELSQLPAATREPFLAAFTDAIDDVFLVGAPIALAGFVITLFLREIPLRTTTQHDLAATGHAFGMAPVGVAAVIEETLVRERAAEAALGRLDQVAARHALPETQIDDLRRLFEDRIAYLRATIRRVRAADRVEAPPERWPLLVELLRVERAALAAAPVAAGPPAGDGGESADGIDIGTIPVGTAGDGARGGPGDARLRPIRHEAAVRVAAAQAALDRLNEIAAGGKVSPECVESMRHMFRGRIERVRQRARMGIEAGGELSPDAWAAVVDVLAAERRSLAEYHAADEVSRPTAVRVGRDLETEAQLVTP